MSEQAVYTHGHHASVVKSHARRTAQNSAAFLLPHIKPHHKILDVGCGPGSITVDLAELVPQGSVVGIDASEDVLSEARALQKDRGVPEERLRFRAHDANELPFADGEFDIVFCHQVLQHVHDPVGVLREMARVARKGGIVAAREADYRSFVWYPEMPGLDRWGEVYQAVAKANGAEPNAGRFLKGWARAAGLFDDVVFTWDSWNYQGPDAVFWAESWKQRALHSSFATTSVQRNVATHEDLQMISRTWEEWGKQQDAFIIIPNGEVLCHVR
ncbi:ubiE/COQ5 methyltransferase [Xylariaceae sp. FL0594]|nr:ubiE/COQ5 methyltransferase [Xylariaceae sp. FL0594]